MCSIISLPYVLWTPANAFKRMSVSESRRVCTTDIFISISVYMSVDNLVS